MKQVSELALFLVRIGFVAVLWIFVLSLLSVIRADLYGRRVMSRLAKQSGPQLSQAPVPELDIDDGDAFEPTKIQMLTGAALETPSSWERKKRSPLAALPDLTWLSQMSSHPTPTPSWSWLVTSGCFRISAQPMARLLMANASPRP